MNCSVSGCANAYRAKGFCPTHLRRFNLHGDPLMGGWKPRSPKKYYHVNVNGVTKPEHVAIAEKIRGKPLPVGAEVHHWNSDKSDNRPENLVVCQDHAYHMLLHTRARAYDACGNVNWRKCSICKKYDAPENLYLFPNKFIARHHACHAAKEQQRLRTI